MMVGSADDSETLLLPEVLEGTTAELPAVLEGTTAELPLLDLTVPDSSTEVTVLTAVGEGKEGEGEDGYKQEPSFRDMLQEACGGMVAAALPPDLLDHPVSSPLPQPMGPPEAADLLEMAPHRQDPHPSPAVTVFCCEVCEKQFTQLWILERHITTSHGSQASRRCKECGVSVHSNNKHACIACEMCPIKFKTRTDLKHHTLSHHNKSRKKCEVCGVRFESQQQLTRHVIECKIQRGQDTTTTTTTLDQHYRCPHCAKELRNFMILQRHQSNTELLSHRCPLCHASFCMHKDLLKHYNQLHVKEGSVPDHFSCPVCDETFEKFRDCSYHILDFHETNPDCHLKLSEEDSRVKERACVYTHEGYLKKKYGWECLLSRCERKGTDSFIEFKPRTNVRVEEYSRSSARLEMSKYPTMLSKHKLVSLESVKRRRRQPGHSIKIGNKKTKKNTTSSEDKDGKEMELPSKSK